MREGEVVGKGGRGMDGWREGGSRDELGRGGPREEDEGGNEGEKIKGIEEGKFTCYREESGMQPSPSPGGNEG